MPAEIPKKPEPAAIRRVLAAWYAVEKRDLPWRASRDPYAIWLSEVMLQQTRVETVIPYYARFLARFPSVVSLADAPLDDVLMLWSGLGYYRRARMLHVTATHVRDEHAGVFPDTVDGLRALHGVGPYTAGAVASIAFGLSAALVDGNVVRVLARLFAIEVDVRSGAGLARIWRLAEALVPTHDAGTWNQALMELGATVCVPRDPRCLLCPASTLCEGRARGIERTLPKLAPKAKPKGERRIALVAQRDGHVLLARRPDSGRFGGMWEPPSIELPNDPQETAIKKTVSKASDADIDLLLQALKLKTSDLQGGLRTGLSHVGEVVHVLSHRRLAVSVFTGELSRRANVGTPPAYASSELVPIAELASRALTTFARKVLAKARVVA
jgi:A/G-specific adenine glycosylase